MPDFVERLWRICATGFCFAVFGTGGLILRFAIFPAVGLVVRERAMRARCSRAILRSSFRAFVGLMHLCRVFTYEVRNGERLRRSGLLIVCNHPSLIDVVFLISLVRNADCVVKSTLLNNPFTRGPILATGFVSNSTGPETVDACVASLRAGSNLIIFPEGTRSVPGQPLSFQRGAANIAVRGGRAITPVSIRCAPPMLTKGEKWYRVPRKRPHFVFEISDDIAAADYLRGDVPPSLAARQMNRDLELHFSQELSVNG